MMAKKSNHSGRYHAVNERIGSIKMPVEGTERPRSFSEGTGIRKYDKNDPSVYTMRKERARAYAERGVGVGLAAQSSSFARSSEGIVADFRNGRRKDIRIRNIESINDAKALVYQLVSVELKDGQYRLGVPNQISNQRSTYSLLLIAQDDDRYCIHIKIKGNVRPQKRTTLLEQLKKDRKLKSEKIAKARRKRLATPDYGHVNGIRGLELLQDQRREK